MTHKEEWEKEFEEEWMIYRPDDPICYEDYEVDKYLAKTFYLVACRKRQEWIRWLISCVKELEASNERLKEEIKFREGLGKAVFDITWEDGT